MVFVMWTRVSDINGLSIGICNNLSKNQSKSCHKICKSWCSFIRYEATSVPKQAQISNLAK